MRNHVPDARFATDLIFRKVHPADLDKGVPALDAYVFPRHHVTEYASFTGRILANGGVEAALRAGRIEAIFHQSSGIGDHTVVATASFLTQPLVETLASLVLG